MGTSDHGQLRAHGFSQRHRLDHMQDIVPRSKQHEATSCSSEKSMTSNMSAAKISSRRAPAAAAPRNSRFAAEEWEGWMEWDGAHEALSPRAIATSPSEQSYHSTTSRLVSGSTDGTSPSEHGASIEPQFQLTVAPELLSQPAPENKKRRIVVKDDGLKNGRQPGTKKVSHNVIEKRYRSNLNDKIAKLRDSVPALRSAINTQKKSAVKHRLSDTDNSDNEASSGLKFNKATVLTKATDYILQLEKQNQRLLEENSGLRHRLHNVDRSHGSPPAYLDVHKDFNDGDSSMTDLTSPESRGDVAESVSSVEDVVGMIKVPDDIRRLRNPASQALYVPQKNEQAESDQRTGRDDRPSFNFSKIEGMIKVPEEFRQFRASTAQSPQEHYAPPITSPYRPGTPEHAVLEENGGGIPRGRVLSRLMVGSLACLMVMEGISEREPNTGGTESRGLFGLPQELLTESRGFRDPIKRRIIAFMSSSQAQYALPILKFSVIIVVLFFALSRIAIRLESKLLVVPPVDNRLDYTLTVDDSDGSPTHERLSAKSSYVLTVEFFAKLAIRFFDFWRWLKGNEEEVLGSPRMRAQQFRKRYTSYASTLPRLLDDRNHT